MTMTYKVKAYPGNNAAGVVVATCSAVNTGHQPTCYLTQLQPDTPYMITVEACTTQHHCSLPSDLVVGRTLPSVLRARNMLSLPRMLVCAYAFGRIESSSLNALMGENIMLHNRPETPALLVYVNMPVL
ncbi:unnamed protein product [Dibothriocephalus latus]|uniref:Fibronectin type-III domain-containing protein n=1 Tax=Dibothriocephalus latus TaxID=60516 RepID=A0A3P7N0F1_DIBLA|nr:unnamed protein product [Dibothriocephalus latus]